MIARKNRIPALWKIDADALRQINFHETAEGTGAKIEITGNKLTITDPCPDENAQNPYIVELNASEPDEDEVIFKAEPAEVKHEQGFSIRVYAYDKTGTKDNGADSQEILLNTALCPIR